MTSREIFARKLKKLIAESGKSQRVISELVGVSKTAISSYINMHQSPTLDSIDIIADFFGLTASDLIRDDY